MLLWKPLIKLRIPLKVGLFVAMQCCSMPKVTQSLGWKAYSSDAFSSVTACLLGGFVDFIPSYPPSMVIPLISDALCSAQSSRCWFEDLRGGGEKVKTTACKPWSRLY